MLNNYLLYISYIERYLLKQSIFINKLKYLIVNYLKYYFTMALITFTFVVYFRTLHMFEINIK